MKSIKEQVEYLRDFVVDEKNALFDRLIQERTDYVTVVLEDLFQSHNQSAVMRSADCYGIQHVLSYFNCYRYSFLRHYVLYCRPKSPLRKVGENHGRT